MIELLDLLQPPQNYEAVQPVGVAKQDPILLHEAESWLPMLVFLMVTQKTNTTKSTIKAYSTSPWPSSSTMSLFKSCIYSPPLLWGANAREVPGKRGTLSFRLLTRKASKQLRCGRARTH